MACGQFISRMTGIELTAHALLLRLIIKGATECIISVNINRLSPGAERRSMADG